MNKMTVTVSTLVLLFLANGFIGQQLFADLKSKKDGDNGKVEFTDLYGDYLGQTPPGDTPKVFAPGIVSDKKLEHSAAVFSGDGNQVFWASRKNQTGKLDIWTMKRIKNRWTKPKVFRPLGDDFMYLDPHISADGKKLYFTAGNEKSNGIWCCILKGNQWGSPQKVKLPSSGKMMFFQPVVANNGNLYCFSQQTIDKKPIQQIVSFKYQDGVYQKPVPLPSHINSESFDWTPYISPDDGYLLFASKRGETYTSLYISFHDRENNQWSESIKLPDGISTATQETFPHISPDGKYMFFTRYNFDNKSMDIYWVSTGFINKLKPQKKSK